ncbi:MAG: 3-hydroxyacyl-CoA dehydrogenase family protein [Candidatus Kapabacteria bacterium]|nr:3-hydroxyacyl-CoA dehydrogenase family protein [Candidatus Kapabacteria bacterium]MDW8011507.1 3-hydroxyacyl-CoA dehydrogenase family protein [Bacteroidota bacterium]
MASTFSVIVVGILTEHPRKAQEITERCRQYEIPVALASSDEIAASPWRELWEKLRQECLSEEQLPDYVPTVVIDPCLLSTRQRLNSLQNLQRRYPRALWLRSGLTETATACAAALQYPEVVAFNGLPSVFQSSDILEIAPALTASNQALATAKDFFASLGFRTEVVADRVGLIIPRILALLINEGAFTVLERVAEPNDIDTAMRLATNYPKGVLEWADEIGLDTIVAILDALHEEYRQERYRTCVLLRQYVRANRLGRVSGQGFYQYG